MSNNTINTNLSHSGNVKHPVPSNISPTYDTIKKLFDPHRCFPILTGIFILIMYVICFIGMYLPNTEIISMGLLFAIHIMFTIYILRVVFLQNSAETTSRDNNTIYILPSVIGTDIDKKLAFIIEDLGIGKLNVTTTLLVSTVTILLSMIIMVITYVKLHSDSVKTEKPIDFGMQTSMKDTLKLIFVAETILLWTIFILYTGYDVLIYIMSEYFIRGRSSSNKKSTAQWMLNSLNVLTSISLFMLAIYSNINIFEMAKNVGAI
jgi:hypothetical protein